MKNKKINKKSAKDESISKKLALHYMKTLVEVARESFLILDAKLKVVLANPTFYKNFKVVSKETENKFVYDLGNGQWDIPELKKLLEKILPKKKVVKDFEVNHVFETIGRKTILLNARQIDSVQLIIIAMEDITSRKNLEDRLAKYTTELEFKVAERTADLIKRVNELQTMNKTMIDRELKMVELKKEIKNLKRGDKDEKGKN